MILINDRKENKNPKSTKSLTGILVPMIPINKNSLVDIIDVLMPSYDSSKAFVVVCEAQILYFSCHNCI